MAGYTLQQLQGIQSQSTGGLTLSQIKGMQTPQPTQEEGFFSSLVKDPLKTLVVKPGVRFGQAIGSLIAPMLGATPEGIDRASKETRTFGGMQIEPQKAFGQGGVRQIVGDVAKTASYLYTGGSASTLARQTLGKQIVRGGLTGLKGGAVGGGLYSFGDAIQQAEKEPSDIAYQTLFGTAVGSAGGLILGATLPTISAGIGKVKEYRNFDSLTGKLNQRNREIFKPTSTQLSDWAEKKVNPIETFTREFGLEEIPTSNNTLQLDDFIAQTDARYKSGAEGFNTILRNNPEVNSLSALEKDAVNSFNKSGLKPSQLEQGRIKIAQEFEAIRREAQASGQLLGDDNIAVAYADNFKDSFWGATRNFGTEEASLANAVNKNIGFAFKNGIENVVTDVNIRNFNKQLQELIYLRDFLESRNGKVPGTGGKMLRYTLRIVGGIGGSGSGPLGTLAGSITADQIAQAIASPTARTWLIRRQLAKLPPAERKVLEQQAREIIENMARKRAETLRLPAPSNSSLVNQGRPIPVVPSNVEYVGGDIAAQSRNNLSESVPPITTATIIQKNANTIKPSINNQGGFVNNQMLRTGAGAGVGSLVGIEKDEQGNYRYNVAKGLAGAVIGGAVARGGKLGMSIEDVSKQGDNLLQEARKYKSAEDFVKSSGLKVEYAKNKLKVAEDGKPITVTVYHGSPDARFAEEFIPTQKGYFKDAPDFLPDNSQWNELYGSTGGGFKTGKGVYDGISFTDDARVAKSYAEKPTFDSQNSVPMVLERTVTLNKPKVIDVAKGEWSISLEKTIEQAKAEGYDGIIFKNIKDNYHPWTTKNPSNNIIAFSENQIKTKSQLTDIFNKAHGIIKKAK